jgi:hypothetical protein
MAPKSTLSVRTRSTLERSIGPERLRGYTEACGGDERLGLDLYLWNGRVSAAAFEDIGFLEVALRNACHEQLSQWHAEQGHTSPWYFSTHVLPRHMQEVGIARGRVAQGKKPETEGRVVAQLMFGFWRLLHSKRYEATIWQWALRFVYPTGVSRTLIHARLDHINTLRNRVAHHEPVHRLAIGDAALGLEAVHGELLETASLISGELGAWLTSVGRVPSLLAQRPG